MQNLFFFYFGQVREQFDLTQYQNEFGSDCNRKVGCSYTLDTYIINHDITFFDLCHNHKTRY